MNNIKKNFLYNLMYQGINFILPFFTAPYLARVLGVEGNGTYSYLNSISQFFVLLTLLGLANYGNREISRVREDKRERSRVFCEIYAMQLLCGIFSLLLFVGFDLLFMIPSYRFLLLVQGIVVLSAMFDISWYFYGMEEYRMMSTRCTCIRIVFFALTFTIVHKEDDLLLYVVLMGIQLMVLAVSLWPFLLRSINPRFPDYCSVLKHFKGNILLFIPLLAISIYRYMDKVMLGSISGQYQVGLYEGADKIISIVQVFYTALGTVMLSRMSAEMKKDNLNTDKLVYYIKKSAILTSVFAAAAFWGILAIADSFIPVYFGDEYYPASVLLKALSPILIMSPIKLIIRTHFLIPLDKNRSYIISVFVGAGVNIIVNLLLIPTYGAKGAVVGTIFAESISTILQIYSLKGIVSIFTIVHEVWFLFASGAVMGGVVYLINDFMEPSILSVFIDIIIGACTYLVLLLLCSKIIKSFKINELLKY